MLRCPSRLTQKVGPCSGRCSVSYRCPRMEMARGPGLPTFKGLPVNQDPHSAEPGDRFGPPHGDVPGEWRQIAERHAGWWCRGGC